MKKVIIAFTRRDCSPRPPSAWFVNSAPSGMADTTFTVGYGESTRMIARKLRKRQPDPQQRFLRRRLRTPSGSATCAPAGTASSPGRARSAYWASSHAGTLFRRKVTIPEGFNLYQIAERLEAGSICDAGAFTGYATDDAFLGQLGIDSPSAEGYLFPDTYVFPEGSDPRDIIAAMHRRMKGVIGTRPAYGPGMSLHEMLTMASLVEKEAKVYTEREFISSVFHNRLRKGMKLDCDPTVRYAVKKFTGPITLSDLKSDSPYNTYRRRGLPPTPICSPGRDSILAAMYPKKTDFLYFVARNDGSHQFSKTLREHNEAVQKYQRR